MLKTLPNITPVSMDEQQLFEASAKLVKVIKTRNAGRVSHLVEILEKQQDAMLSVEIFVRVNRYLEKTDKELQQWFHSVYFQDCSPQYKAMWLDFVELCSLSILSQSAF
ncbi:MAG: hypothetical protein AAGD25_23880 [Cyanobacteria bacterium P01_F01_bin.150]